MSFNLSIENLRLNSNGVRVTTGATSASGNLPTTSDGRIARFVRILCETGTAYIVLSGTASPTCTTNNILVTSNEPLIVATDNAQYFGYIQSTAGAVGVSISAVDF